MSDLERGRDAVEAGTNRALLESIQNEALELELTGEFTAMHRRKLSKLVKMQVEMETSAGIRWVPDKRGFERIG